MAAPTDPTVPAKVRGSRWRVRGGSEGSRFEGAAHLHRPRNLVQEASLEIGQDYDVGDWNGVRGECLPLPELVWRGCMPDLSVGGWDWHGHPRAGMGLPAGRDTSRRS